MFYFVCVVVFGVTVSFFVWKRVITGLKFSFAISENCITLHEHPIRISVLKLMKSSFTMEPYSSTMEHHPDKESIVSTQLLHNDQETRG